MTTQKANFWMTIIQSAMTTVLIGAMGFFGKSVNDWLNDFRSTVEAVQEIQGNRYTAQDAESDWAEQRVIDARQDAEIRVLGGR